MIKPATCVPEQKTYVPDPYDWQERHRQVIEACSRLNPLAVAIGDSIFHYWGGEPSHPIKRGQDSWDALFGPYRTVNMGFGMDRIENMLWRVENGELDGISPSVALLEGGTNNYAVSTDEEIAIGMENLASVVATRLPKARLLLLGLTPSANSDDRARNLTSLYSRLDGALGGRLRFLDVAPALRKADGAIDESLFCDGIHPNEEGNRRLAAVIAPVLASLFGA